MQPEPRRLAERLDDLPRRPVRHADIADVPVLDERIERAQRLLDWGGGVEAVDLVEIDMVELEPL